MNNLSINKRKAKNRRSVRKTLTIDADIAESIERRLQESPGLKEKDLINALFRIALNSTREEKQRAKFTPLAFEGGLRKGVAPQELERLLDEI